MWCIYRHCDSYEDRNENMTYLASQLTKWHIQKRAVIFFQTRETCKHKTRLCYILCLRRSQSFVPSVTLGPARRLLSTLASGSLDGNSQQSRLLAVTLAQIHWGWRHRSSILSCVAGKIGLARECCGILTKNQI